MDMNPQPTVIHRAPPCPTLCRPPPERGLGHFIRTLTFLFSSTSLFFTEGHARSTCLLASL
ncbi:hypothetical protein M404DRAFT_1006316 [Pisolithus tinctorius Marx 270]|uniref:Uncharacterized protein n=1 Tax=Pisolithus tinctorius Marx 270 TaxID=870435 RepID=A0A0C3IJ71_PISTI|nr:hypothetical protein M404DRAFT_1006316 [Pisolithus tinctorius Marx 270]